MSVVVLICFVVQILSSFSMQVNAAVETDPPETVESAEMCFEYGVQDIKRNWLQSKLKEIDEANKISIQIKCRMCCLEALDVDGILVGGDGSGWLTCECKGASLEELVRERQRERESSHNTDKNHKIDYTDTNDDDDEDDDSDEQAAAHEHQSRATFGRPRLNRPDKNIFEEMAKPFADAFSQKMAEFQRQFDRERVV